MYTCQCQTPTLSLSLTLLNTGSVSKCLINGVALIINNLPAKAGEHKRHRFNPWVGKIPWRRAWPPTPVFFAGESHGQRSLVGYSPWGLKDSDRTEATLHSCTQSITLAPNICKIIYSVPKLSQISTQSPCIDWMLNT